MENSVWIDIGLWSAYILTGITLVAMIGGFVLDLLADPAGSKKTLIFLGVLVVILGFSFAIAPGEFDYKGVEEYGFSSTSLKMIGGGLIATYILTALAVVAAVVSEVANSFK